MKRILYLSFYFEPDLCAGSFRNTPLVKALAEQIQDKAVIDLLTTLPNRYSTFVPEAPQLEDRGTLKIRRVTIPKHQSGIKDQVLSFKAYYNEVKKYVKGQKYDLVVASSSRLFTAYLGYTIAKKLKVPLYLDIRDIFYDTLEDVLPSGLVKKIALPFIKKIEQRTFRYARHINLISEGFKPYFETYGHAQYSYYPNGIDDVFIQANSRVELDTNVTNHLHSPKTIVYAGNLGEGQGLHKIIPPVAKDLGADFRFIVMGDGGAKQKLIEEIHRLGVSNVELRNPVKREELIRIYQSADYLFVHLNNYKAFEKVLPSKLFELATFPKPLIAGVGGFAANFIKSNIKNVILFEPCHSEQLIEKLKRFEYKQFMRTSFIDHFGRDAVNRSMAESILRYL